MNTDTARLDWILRRKTTPYRAADGNWRIAGDEWNQYGRTPREAIDRAMERELIKVLIE